MSEEINEIEENDSVEMNHSEFEKSDLGGKMEVQHAHVSMSDAEFEAKLTEFFTKHKEKKLKFVPQIVETFKGHEAEVLEHLHNKYVLGIATKSKKKAAQKLEGHDEHTKSIESSHGGKHGASEPAKPKSKKKLVIIIIIVVVLAGLGVTGFLMKDKLMGKKGETEQAGEKGEGEKKAEAPKPKETAAPTAATNDSTKTTGTDSAKAVVTEPAKPAADSAKKN